MKLLRAMLTVAGLTMLSRIFGFIRDAMTAIFLGAGPLADAFFVALKLPNLFRRVSAEGAFSVAFVPLFAKTIEQEGEKTALFMARNVMGFMAIILTLFTLLALWGMPLIVTLIAPGFDADGARYQAAIDMSRLTFPYIIFISLSALLGGVLNTVGRFAAYAFLPCLLNIVLIAILFWNDVFGETPAHALSLGLLIAGVVQFLMIFVLAAKHGWLVYPTWPKLTPRIRQLFTLMVPGIIGAGAYHLNIFADMIIASFLPAGSISYLYYADRLQQLPLGVVGIAIGTALLPLLSRSVASENYKEANTYFNRAIELCLLFALPATVALIIAAEPIIFTLFNYGAFSMEDTSITATVLVCYAIGLPLYIVSKVFQSVCFAGQDTKTPVKISIIGAVINIVFGVALSRYIGVAGIALATSLSGIVQIGLLYRQMRGMSHLYIDQRLRVNGFKIIVSCLIMAMVLIGYLSLMGWQFDIDKITRAVQCLGMVASGGLAYVLSIFTLKVMTKNDLLKMLNKDKG